MKKKHLLLGLIFIATAAAYVNSVGASFHYDDYHAIVFNPHIKELKNIPKFFVSPRMTSGDPGGAVGYRPVVTATLALNYAVSGLAPWSYHVFNILLHFLTAFAVFLLADFFIRKSGGPWWPAFFPALIFALNPVHTNAVSYIIARSAILCTLFYLFAFYFYLKFREGGRGWMLAASLVSFILALLSKEIAVTFPAIVLLYEVLLEKKGGGRRFLYSCFFGAAAAVFTGARLVIFSDTSHHVALFNSPGRLLAVPWLVLNYLKKLFFPVNLNFFPLTPKFTSILAPELLLSIAVILAGAAIIILPSRKRNLVVFFVAWFFIALSPELLLNLREQMVEYRLYLPSAGLIILLGLAASGNIRNLPVWVGSAAAIAACLFTLTVSRNEVYRDDISLWSDACCKSSRSGLARAYLGVSFLGGKKYAEAAECLSSALEMEPEMPDAGRHLNNLGLAYEELGEEMKAYEAYFKALAVHPDDPVILKNMGRLCMKSGRLDEARGYFLRALKASPRDIEIRAALSGCETEKSIKTFLQNNSFSDIN